jgi:predicted O-methyltransferase YrrM
MPRSLAAELKAEPPALHASGGTCAGLHWAALAWLEQTVQPGWATIETGAGASTMIFAARGAEHEAVTPAADEAERIEAECRVRGISTERVRFRIGPSHEVLATWEPRPLDLVLLDGAHGFPYPVLDWWYVMPHLKVGGVLLLDDAYMGAVRMLVEHLRSRPAWSVEDAVGYRTVVVRKLADELPPFDSLGEEGVRGVSFGYLPPHRRAVAAVRHRVFSTRAGLAAVRAVRKHAPFLFGPKSSGPR